MKKIDMLFTLLIWSVCLSGILQAQNIQATDDKPFVLGVTHTIRSAELGEERILNIYLPEGYSADEKQKYPVIYLLDGSKDEDFIHIAGLMQFANFPWVKVLPKSILVGVANVDRKRDFTYPTTIERDKKDFLTTGGSAKFINFIEKELQPFIDKKYRTNGTQTIIGQSFGGLLATEVLLKKPGLFDRYIIVSPSLWWDDQSLLRVKQKALDNEKMIFIAVGKEGDIMEKDARRLHKLLSDKKSENMSLQFEYFPDEDHATILHQAVYKAFQNFKLNDANKKIGKIYDHHVHLMSPRLIKYFKDVGIPFSRLDAAYSDIDTIIERSKTNQMTLVSMAYLYGHPEFGKIENEYETVKAENDYVINAKARSPKNIKAFCGINPLKSYALEEVKRCHKKLKADGLKIHSNANQIYLTEPEHLLKIKPIYQYAADNNLPILLHFDNSHPKFGEPDIKIFGEEILEKIKPTTIYIAHFGTSGGFNAKTKRVIDAFINLYKTNPKVKKHRILFDISAVALDKDSEGVSKLTDAEFTELAIYTRKLGFENIIFGTDYPLYTIDEYLNILKTKLKLTEPEIKEMLGNK